MSARARRKNRNRGLKKGFRRENGPTPRHKVRVLRDAHLSDESAVGSPISPSQLGSRAEVPWSDTATGWASSLASAQPQQFPGLFRQAVTDDAGVVAVLHRMLDTASEWCRRHGAHHCASELEEMTARLSDFGEDLELAGDAVEEEIASRHDRAAATGRTSPALSAHRTTGLGRGDFGLPAVSPAPRPRQPSR